MNGGSHGWSRPEDESSAPAFLCSFHAATTARLDNRRTAQIAGQCPWCCAGHDQPPPAAERIG